MIAIWGTAILVGMIAACIGPFYYCKRSRQNHERSETIGTESPLVIIQKSRPQRFQFSTDASASNSSDTTDTKETKQVLPETEPVSSEEARIVRMQLPRNERRLTSSIWSSAFKNHLENITNSSSEMCGSTRVVTVQVEVNPSVSEPSSHETVDSRDRRSIRRNFDDSSGLVPNRNYLYVEKARKASTVARKWKNLKKTLVCTSSDTSASMKAYETDETQRLNVPSVFVPHRSPMGHSTMLQKNRFVDASTSTKISANALQVDETRKNRVNFDENIEPASKRSENDPRPDGDALQEMVPLLDRESPNEKSICDIRINGLTMTESELLDLFEATKNKKRSVSFVTTDEASIISIRFDRRRDSNEQDRTTDSSFYKSAMKKFYSSMQERFEELSFSKLFRSLERPKRSRSTPIRIPDYSRVSSASRNETWYIEVPNVRNKMNADESVHLGRKSSLRKRCVDSYTSRLAEERRI